MHFLGQSHKELIQNTLEDITKLDDIRLSGLNRAGDNLSC